MPLLDYILKTYMNNLLVISTNSKTYSSKFEHSKTNRVIQEQIFDIPLNPVRVYKGLLSKNSKISVKNGIYRGYAKAVFQISPKQFWWNGFVQL